MENGLNISKYSNALLYFLNCCNNQFLGRTKLNKLFYYLDFVSYRDKRQSVTGDTYTSMQYGPVPDSLSRIIHPFIKDKIIDARQITYSGGKEKTEYKVLKKADLSVFSEYEKGLLKKICDKFVDWSTDEIVTQTHLEAPWFYTKIESPVDYNLSKDIEIL